MPKESQISYTFLAVVGLAAGLYPLVFYYDNNFTLINSWSHFTYFAGLFIVLPIVAMLIAGVFAKKWLENRMAQRLFLFVNGFAFLNFLQLCLRADISKKWTLIVLLVAAVFAFFLWNHIKKVVVLQFVLAVIALVSFAPQLFDHLTASNQWKTLPDAISEVRFVETPNIYVIQPDGYVNPSELEKGYYDIDNSNFENFLSAEGFKTYTEFRSNYGSTLSTNSAIFAMKHHYYNEGQNFSETLNARNVIVGENPVLDILKDNGYTSYFISEKPYLFLNKPTVGYDYSNYTSAEVPFISTGLRTHKEIEPWLRTYLTDSVGTPKFMFVQMLLPGHINNQEVNSVGVEGERQSWMTKLETANQKLKEIITMIKQNDPNPLIVVMADHGGFVGMEYTNQSYSKMTDRDKIYSVFSSILSVHWPEEPPSFDSKLVSSVNVFRILFAHLSKSTAYLDHLEPDESYLVVKEGAEKGIYQYIAPDGSITFEKK
ncbi:MAG: hypothetical protein R3359_10640 [Marinirhabdus sp.]|nr:hypothetical protein [Marinirhabdus sp.]